MNFFTFVFQRPTCQQAYLSGDKLIIYSILNYRVKGFSIHFTSLSSPSSLTYSFPSQHTRQTHCSSIATCHSHLVSLSSPLGAQSTTDRRLQLQVGEKKVWTFNSSLLFTHLYSHLSLAILLNFLWVLRITMGGGGSRKGTGGGIYGD